MMVHIFKIQNRRKVEDIKEELTVFRIGTGDIPNRHEHIWCRWHGDNDLLLGMCYMA